MIIFDLDGTLAESKQPLDGEMAALLAQLLRVDKVAVISGAAFKQFEVQFLKSLSARPEELSNLFIFPTNATAFYRYQDGAWGKVYEEDLTAQEAARIMKAIEAAEAKLGAAEPKVYGPKIDNRGSQVTYSGIGQEAPLEAKRPWDPDQAKRKRMVEELSLTLQDFEIRIGGMTSIDITRKGIDKAYGIRQIEKNLGIDTKDIIYVGDALFPGGNDYPAKSTGVECVQVDTVADTKRFIQNLIVAKSAKTAPAGALSGAAA